MQVATEAEFRLGAGRPYKSLVGVFWGTGVGGGLILDGKPWLGRGGAGEIGHIVIKLDGARCPCGRRGCMEAYAGRAAMEAKARREHEDGRKTDLFKIMKKHGHDRLTSGIWERALNAEDSLATELIDRAVAALGAGIASVINLLDVEAVIIGGGLGTRLGEPYAKRIVKAMHPHLFNDDNPPAVEVAALGDLGGAIGAALQTEGLGTQPGLQHRRRRLERVRIPARERRHRLQRLGEHVAQAAGGRPAADLHLVRVGSEGELLDPSASPGVRVALQRQRHRRPRRRRTAFARARPWSRSSASGRQPARAATHPANSSPADRASPS